MNKTQDKTRPRGMQEGHLVYEEQMFLNQVTDQYRTTNDILKQINQAPMRDISWNTLQKYLNNLAEQDKIELRKAGRISLWRKVETNDKPKTD